MTLDVHYIGFALIAGMNMTINLYVLGSTTLWLRHRDPFNQPLTRLWKYQVLAIALLVAYEFIRLYYGFKL